MPVPTPTPTDESELQSPKREPETDDRSVSEELRPADPDAPVSFVPHTAVENTVRPKLLRIQTGRYGELDEHELVRLLDTIEDERARARFRESVYISVFVWLAITLFVFFGPKYLWHSPRIVLPSEVLQARELTQLTDPKLSAPHPRAAPRSVDDRTLEHLRSAEPKVPRAPAPQPRPEPQPETPRTEAPVQPRAEPRSQPSPTLRPSPAPPNLPSAPTPQPQPRPVTRTPPPVVADAPRPQPSSHPDFTTGSESAGDQIQNAVRNASPGEGGSVGIPTRSRNGAGVGMGPAEILSDTQGVNFNPYLQRILRQIYDQWIPLIPEEARPPLSKSGVTALRVRIGPDGGIQFLGIDDSTHDNALNRAAWGSITGVNQFPPLPSQFHGPNLELRIHYLVNRQTE